MLYILGKILPSNKRITVSLTALYGINSNRAKELCRKLGIGENMKMESLKSLQKQKLLKELNNYVLNKDLMYDTKTNILRLRNISSYKGIRHFLGLPINGQRTHSNAKTQKKFKLKRK